MQTKGVPCVTLRCFACLRRVTAPGEPRPPRGAPPLALACLCVAHWRRCWFARSREESFPRSLGSCIFWKEGRVGCAYRMAARRVLYIQFVRRRYVRGRATHAPPAAARSLRSARERVHLHRVWGGGVARDPTKGGAVVAVARVLRCRAAAAASPPAGGAFTAAAHSSWPCGAECLPPGGARTQQTVGRSNRENALPTGRVMSPPRWTRGSFAACGRPERKG